MIRAIETTLASNAFARFCSWAALVLATLILCGSPGLERVFLIEALDTVHVIGGLLLMIAGLLAGVFLSSVIHDELVVFLLLALFITSCVIGLVMPSTLALQVDLLGKIFSFYALFSGLLVTSRRGNFPARRLSAFHVVLGILIGAFVPKFFSPLVIHPSLALMVVVALLLFLGLRSHVRVQQARESTRSRSMYMQESSPSSLIREAFAPARAFQHLCLASLITAVIFFSTNYVYYEQLGASIYFYLFSFSAVMARFLVSPPKRLVKKRNEIMVRLLIVIVPLVLALILLSFIPAQRTSAFPILASSSSLLFFSWCHLSLSM